MTTEADDRQNEGEKVASPIDIYHGTRQDVEAAYETACQIVDTARAVIAEARGGESGIDVKWTTTMLWRLETWKEVIEAKVVGLREFLCVLNGRPLQVRPLGGSWSGLVLCVDLVDRLFRRAGHTLGLDADGARDNGRFPALASRASLMAECRFDWRTLRAGLEMEYIAARAHLITAGRWFDSPEPASLTRPKDSHDPDFGFVSWGGQSFTFNGRQAKVVAALWDAARSRHPGRRSLPTVTLRKIAGGRCRSLRDLFKANGKINPAYGEMIVRGGYVGSYELCRRPND